jgi:hypothetical protein
MDYAAATLPQESIRLSPFMVKRGYQPRTSFDWKAPEPLKRLTLNKEDAKAWLERMHSAWEAARTNLMKS